MVSPDGELLDVHAHAGIVTHLGLLTPDERQQIIPVNRPIEIVCRLHTESPEDGRQQVDRLNQSLVPAAAELAPRQADHERRVDELLVEPGAKPANIAMLAQRLALVAGEDEQGIVHPAHAPQGLE